MQSESAVVSITRRPRSIASRWVSDGRKVALEIGAEAILMGKNAVEGVYDGDPRTDPDAQFLPELTHLEAIERGLKVMDTTALSLCMDNDLPIHVFALERGNILRLVAGERVGTIISTQANRRASDGR